MTASQASEPEGWGEFMQRPARYASAAHVRACFNNSIGEDLAASSGPAPASKTAFRSCLPRTTAYRRRRTARRAASATGPSCFCPPEIAALAQRAGAVWWAASFATAVRGSEVQALQKLLGEDLYQFALANRDMAGPAQNLQRIENLENAVAADGWSCFEAWRRALPRAAAQRIC